MIKYTLRVFMTQPWQTLPPLFVERLSKLVAEPQLTAVLEALCQARPTTLRANTLKITPNELQEQFAKDGIELEPVPWFENAFVVATGTKYEVMGHPLYTAGALYLQSLSSMIPPLVLSPQPGDRILDLTAAPGSKTTQIAAMMNNTGEITANDLSPVRLFKLQANLRMQGVKNTFARRGPGQLFWQKYPDYFQRTLVDVPCSMEGRIHCPDPESYEEWSLKKIKELSIRQKHLLRSAISATQPGGVIVYSTCTLAPEENEEVVNWAIEKEKGAVELETIEIPELSGKPGITQWGNDTYDTSLSKTLRILPSTTMEGFYVAKLRKKASTITYPILPAKRRQSFRQSFHRKRK
jgi:NOL1/NOP2/sun family putative RNA methylase